ncbi:hypothetical protein KUF71_016969 [Frankliniella fusca]|uniref:Uncharacterized protein n=1 Tax=Frankliniella fusca TaxID=407009 RepID=A0AAE1LQD5_9NEOP|nr:hypothetical protein KUF71_016969 [Frankliniella fusca]
MRLCELFQLNVPVNIGPISFKVALHSAFSSCPPMSVPKVVLKCTTAHDFYTI